MSMYYNQNTPTELLLEPRVVKLEAGLDRLTDDLRSLAGIVREQGSNVEKQLQALTIAVTEAQAPKKTDWSVIISAGLLMLALGSAAYWPLSQTSQVNKQAVDNLQIKFEAHQQLETHPAAAAKMAAFEQDLLLANTQTDYKLAALNTKFQRETALASEANHNIIAELDVRIHSELALRCERTDARLTKLEELNKFNYEQDEIELRASRARLYGENTVRSSPSPLTK